MRGIIITLGILSALVFMTGCGTTKPSEPKEGIEHKSKKFTVVIDPGHGGKDKGATGASGAYEKEFSLQVAQKIVQLLEKEQSIEVHLTRKDDSFISSRDSKRVKIASSMNADVLVSIHGNTFTDARVSGIETYYYTNQSRTLAEKLHKYVAEATQFRDRGVKIEDFFVIREAMMPAVLLELGYLTNQKEESLLLQESMQQHIAEAIVAGLKEYIANSQTEG